MIKQMDRLKKTEYCKTAWDVTENYANTSDPSYCVNKTNGDYPEDLNCVHIWKR